MPKLFDNFLDMLKMISFHFYLGITDIPAARPKTTARCNKMISQTKCSLKEQSSSSQKLDVYFLLVSLLISDVISAIFRVNYDFC